MSRSPKYHITGSKLLPTQKKGGLPSTKWTTLADGAFYPTALYLRMDYKEDNTRLIVSQLAAIQFLQINTTLQFVHMEGRIFLPRVEEEG